MNVNIIIECQHTECKYCNVGQCGKDEIYLDDNECLAIRESEENENDR